MEKILNAFLYCIYLMEVRLHYLSNKVNPAGLLFYIPFIKKKFERKNQDPWEEYNKVFTDKVGGDIIARAAGITAGVIFGIIIGSVFLVNRFFKFYDYVPISYYIICGAIGIGIGYLYMLKNDKYLNYFEQFEKWPKSQKRKYIILSFFTILASIAYFFLSMMCC